MRNSKENIMDTRKVLAELKKLAGFFEVYQKTTFSCVRHDKNGNTQEVDVDICDAGPDADPLLRYSCVARSQGEKMATGNPDSSICEALHGVHWHHLDD